MEQGSIYPPEDIQYLKKGIPLAEQQGLPIATTPGVIHPWDDRPGTGDWALKTNPYYHMKIGLPVYQVNDMIALKKLFAEHSELSKVLFFEKEKHSIVMREHIPNDK